MSFENLSSLGVLAGARLCNWDMKDQLNSPSHNNYSSEILFYWFSSPIMR